jgi:C4-dicarboxylate-specific signal transduction histidine kinase
VNIPLRVLIVEDSRDDAELLEEELRRGGFQIRASLRVDTAAAMEAALRDAPWDLILSDYSMPWFGGLEALALVRRLGLDLPFILVSGMMGEETAVEAMKCGAHDYVMKDRLARLAPAIRRELAEAVVRRDKRRAQEDLRTANEALEAKVAERTAELSLANLQLRNEIAERERAQEERDRMAAELLQGQKLQAIGQLSAGIAHEINNPLSYILSNMRCLAESLDEIAPLLRQRDGTPTPDITDLRSALQESLEGAEKIRRIVRGLREFSHLDERELRDVDLNHCVENALRLCANEITHKASVVRDFSEMLQVRCYPQQIEQILVNLIMNALQAIPERGVIGIGTKREGREAVIRIRDTGTGITPEHLKKLFEPFFTTKPVGKGTGLGLHVAYKIARAHGGRIDVTSTVGAGSEFSIFIPISGPEDRPRPAKELQAW